MNRLKIISIIFLLSTFLFSFINSCDSTNPKPPEKPPGYQEDIPWPSLADSPWPIYNHDTQSTGRSHFVGPSLGISQLLIPVKTQSGITCYEEKLFLVNHFKKSVIQAIDYDGMNIWESSDSLIFLDNHSTPLVTSAGNLIFSSGISGYLYCVSKEGRFNWKKKFDGRIEQSTVTIDLEGNIYFIAGYGSNKLYCISQSDGSIKWHIYNEDFPGWPGTSLSFSPDGKTLYIPGNTNSVYAFDLNSRTLKWTFGYSTLWSAPLIDSQGNIYLNVKSESSNNKYAYHSLTPEGNIRWIYVHNSYLNYDSFFDSKGTIDLSGNLYFATDTLYKFDYNGNLKWMNPLNGFCDTPLISDREGSVFILVENFEATSYNVNVRSYSNLGTEKWRVDLLSEQEQIGGLTPIILNNMIIFTPRNTTSNLYKIL